LEKAGIGQASIRRRILLLLQTGSHFFLPLFITKTFSFKVFPG
jgi:hypothetical protein